MESARCPQPKMASPTQSAASKGEHVPPTSIKETPKPDETANEETSAGPSQPVIQQTSDKLKTLKVPDISEATLESGSAREPAPQCNALQVEEEVQQKLAAAEGGSISRIIQDPRYNLFIFGRKNCILIPTLGSAKWILSYKFTLKI